MTNNEERRVDGGSSGCCRWLWRSNKRSAMGNISRHQIISNGHLGNDDQEAKRERMERNLRTVKIGE